VKVHGDKSCKLRLDPSSCGRDSCSTPHPPTPPPPHPACDVGLPVLRLTAPPQGQVAQAAP
jgi:hypothetical protein